MYDKLYPPYIFLKIHIRSKRDDKQILFLHFEMNKLDLQFFVSGRKKKRLLDLTFSTVFLVLKYTFFFRFHRRIFSTLYFKYLFFIYLCDVKICTCDGDFGRVFVLVQHVTFCIWSCLLTCKKKSGMQNKELHVVEV